MKSRVYEERVLESNWYPIDRFQPFKLSEATIISGYSSPPPPSRYFGPQHSGVDNCVDNYVEAYADQMVAVRKIMQSQKLGLLL